MTQSGPVDYAKTFFIHQTLTKIQGEPDYATLKILKKELNKSVLRKKETDKTGEIYEKEKHIKRKNC